MISISQRTRNIVFYTGATLLVAGTALAYWALRNLSDLPNHLRLAALIPITLSNALLRIDQYRDWRAIKGIARGHAIGALLVPPLLLVGSLIWLLAAPAAHG